MHKKGSATPIKNQLTTVCIQLTKHLVIITAAADEESTIKNFRDIKYAIGRYQTSYSVRIYSI